ncbi:unnamed protein product [Effrenium voratum]|uniref:Uncharacterized protein n=1 Tax=Effrenium voratum TaxID=2562239 RepID=A0AA36N3H5_9DINO|nr:unnamed protein product [Effrenium voratum]
MALARCLSFSLVSAALSIHVTQTSELSSLLTRGPVAVARPRSSLSLLEQRGRYFAHAHVRSKRQNSSCTTPSLQGHLRNASTIDVENRLQAGKPVSFIRIGDGDVFCMSGSGGQNLEGYGEYKSQCKELGTSLQQLGEQDDSNMYVLVGAFFLCGGVGDRFESFLQTQQLHSNFKGFLTSIFYLDLSGLEQPKGSGHYGEVPNPVVPTTFPALVGRKVVVLGPDHLRRLTKTLNIASFLDASNAADRVDELVTKMKAESAKWPKENVVFLISGGFGGRLAVLRAFKELGQKDSFIDTGASLDGFAGVASRDFNDKARLCGILPEYMAPGLCNCHGNQCVAA